MPIGTSFSSASMADGAPMVGLFGFETDFVEIGIHQGTGVSKFVSAGSGNATVNIEQVNGVARIHNNDNSTFHVRTHSRPFSLRYGKRLWFGARINLRDFDAQDWFIGMTITDSTVIASIPDDIVGFICTESDGTIDALTRSGGTSTRTEQVDNAFTADDQWRELKVIWNGNGRLTYYIEGKPVQLHSSNIPTDTLMHFAMEVRGVAAENMDVDFVYCYQER